MYVRGYVYVFDVCMFNGTASVSRCRTCFSFIFDGMTQFTTQCPAQPRFSKSMDQVYRLAHHLIGALTHGAFHEALLFSILPWFRSGGNLFVTLMLRTLIKMKETWQQLHPDDPQCKTWPKDMYVQFDNASGDGKNKKVLSFCAWLVYARMFEKVQLHSTYPCSSPIPQPTLIAGHEPHVRIGANMCELWSCSRCNFGMMTVMCTSILN